MPSDDPAEELAQALVETLKRKGDLSDPRVEAAFRAVPRHFFLPDLPLEQIYADEAVPIKRDSGGKVVSSSSQPSMMALMLHQLDLRPGDNVLEIGTGTGYNAAIMHHVVGENGNVTSIELDGDVAHQAQENLERAGIRGVKIIQADGALGYAPYAAFDRIIATVGIWDVPIAWVEQLKPNGILVAPLWLDALQVSVALSAQPDGSLYSAYNMLCGFVLMRGAAAGPVLFAQLPDSELTLASNDIEQIDVNALHLLLSSSDTGPRPLRFSLKAGEYWYGFLPFLILNVPQGYRFVMYMAGEEETSFGLAGHGFALTSPESACFVPYTGEGEARWFANANAFIAMDETLKTWDSLKRPNSERLRLRLIPLEQEPPVVTVGRLYTRQHHFLHAWLEYK